MLYEKVVAILNKGKEEDVDLSIAKEMLIAENKEDVDNIKTAYKVVEEYYTEITTFNRDGKLDLLKELCELVEDNNTEGVKNFLEKYDDYIKKSFAEAKANN